VILVDEGAAHSPRRDGPSMNAPRRAGHAPSLRKVRAGPPAARQEPNRLPQSFETRPPEVRRTS